jgi:Flp pilus assembly pilin Flp
MLNLMLATSNYLKARFSNFTNDERGEVNVVAIVVLIGVAVLLAILFKEQVANLIKSLFNAIGGQANNAITDPA